MTFLACGGGACWIFCADAKRHTEKFCSQTEKTAEEEEDANDCLEAAGCGPVRGVVCIDLFLVVASRELSQICGCSVRREVTGSAFLCGLGEGPPLLGSLAWRSLAGAADLVGKLAWGRDRVV